MQTYNVKNPDPALPERIAFVVFVLACSTDLLSSLPIEKYIVLNWWPILHVTLIVWGFCRVFDLFTGGPPRRSLMRRAWRDVQRNLRAQQHQ